MFLKRENGRLGWHYVLSLFDLSDREERDMASPSWMKKASKIFTLIAKFEPARSCCCKANKHFLISSPTRCVQLGDMAACYDKPKLAHVAGFETHIVTVLTKEFNF